MEMLLVLGILSLIAGFLGVNISKMLQEQRFRTEVSQVVDQLRLAQDLMLIHDTNVQVKFVADQNTGWEYGIAFDTPIPKGWAQELKRPHQKLKMIHYVNFHDKNRLFDDSEHNEFQIQFLSGGAVMSKGVLVLASANPENGGNVLARYVWISGSPQPIVTVNKMPEEYNEKDVTFETRLTQITHGEIQAKEQAK